MQFTLNNTCRLCLRNYTVVVVLHRAAISGSFSLRHPPAATRATTTPGRDTLFTNTSASTLQLIYCSSSTHHSSSHQFINSSTHTHQGFIIQLSASSPLSVICPPSKEIILRRKIVTFYFYLLRIQIHRIT